MSVTPRNSLESSIMIFHSDSGGGNIMYYFPQEDTFGYLGQLSRLIGGFMLTSLFTFLLICIRLCLQKEACYIQIDSRYLKS